MRFKERHLPQEHELDLRTCNLGSEVKEAANPFTGDPWRVHIDDGLTDDERNAVRALLARVGASEPDPDTYCQIRLSDGSRVNVAIGTLNMAHPCVAFAVEFQSLSPAVAEFVFSLAQAGNMTIRATSTVVAVLSPATKVRVQERWPTAQVVGSPVELESWLRRGIRDGTIR